MSATVIDLPLTRLTREHQDLVLEGQAIVRDVAASLWRRRPGVIRWEDLLSIGNVALAEVVPGFDRNRGTLRQWAWSAIHGAMVDALKSETRLQRVVRRGAYKAVDVQTDEGDLECFSDALLAGMAASLSGEVLRTDDPEGDVAFHETLTLVRRAVSELSAEDQRLVELHYVLDMPLEAAGREMRMGRTTVKARHRGLLKRLGARLVGFGPIE